MRFWDACVILASVINMNNELKNEIAVKISRAMHAAQMSYGDLSKATGIPKSALQRYATGTTAKLPLPRLEAIASALNLDPAYLMGWEDDPKSANKKKDAPAMSESVMQLVKVIEQLSPENQKTLAVVAKGLLRDQSES